MMRGKFIAGTFFVALLIAASTRAKESAFHVMKIKEFFPGAAVAPNAQYVVLQMYAAFQNLVAGTEVRVFNNTGTLIKTFTFAGNVPNSNNQATILIAMPECTTFFHVAADLVMDTAAIPLAGGKICFFDPGFFQTIDCVSWGNYSGSAAGTGTPFYFPRKLKLGWGVRRDISKGNPSLLEEIDDTQNSAADFFFTNLPAPRNNANATGTPPPSTCGNNTLEGLEQCDDGNTTSGDGCDANCQVEPMKGDMNEDGLLAPSDIVFMLTCVFAGTGNCELSYGDVNCDAVLSPSDVVFELLAVFAGDPLPC